MYNAQEVKAMTQADAQERFDMVATLYYGTDRWKTEFANTTGMTYQGVQQWFTDRSQPPAWAFLLIQAWKDHAEITEQLQSLKSVIDYVNKLD